MDLLGGHQNHSVSRLVSRRSGHVTDFYHRVKETLLMTDKSWVPVTKTSLVARPSTEANATLSQNHSVARGNFKVEPGMTRRKRRVGGRLSPMQ